MSELEHDTEAMLTELRVDPKAGPWAAAVRAAELTDNLMLRIVILSTGAQAQMTLEFFGAPKTPYTLDRIAARHDEMAREVRARGLLA